MLASGAVEAAIPLVAKRTFDGLLATRDPAAPRIAALAILALALLRGATTYGAGVLGDWVGQRVVTDLRNALAAHLQRLDLGYLHRQRGGQIVSRVTSDASLVRGLLVDTATSAFMDATRLVALAAVALYMDAPMAVAGLGALVLAALPVRRISATLRQTSRQQQKEMGRLTAALHESVLANRLVKAFRQERGEERRLVAHTERLFRLYVRASALRWLPITEILGGCAVAGIVWWGGASVVAGERTPGAFLGFVVTLVLLYEPFRRLLRTNFTVQQGLAGGERIFEFLDAAPRVVDRPRARPLAGITRAIAFEDVSFAYEPDRLVLQGVRLDVPAGNVVALVGPSGGGKSTLADLIPRFYDPTAGRVTIDGVDVRDVTLDSLRAHVSVVAQFTFLFNDTIRANIGFGDPTRGDDDIVAAAHAANAHEFITALPAGYDTPIGDLGVRLSGGQRQRIAIARALLKDAPILILDEATSALDSESEALIQEALERLMRHRTTLVVAHRLSTVRRADEIAVVAGGRIVERGAHAELLAQRGAYWTLHQTELAGAHPEPAAADTAD
jgi:subfamily B ATP-binding cassette protein MsbA